MSSINALYRPNDAWLRRTTNSSISSVHRRRRRRRRPPRPPRPRPVQFSFFERGPVLVSGRATRTPSTRFHRIQPSPF